MLVRIFAIISLIPVVVFGQLSTNTVTVNASQSSDAAPDEAVFGVAVYSAIEQGLDDIVGALAGSGITTANFSGVSFTQDPSLPANQTSRLRWDFLWTVPLA